MRSADMNIQCGFFYPKLFRVGASLKIYKNPVVSIYKNILFQSSEESEAEHNFL